MEYKEIKLSDLKNLNNYKNDSLLKISTPLFNSSLILPCVFVIAVIWMIISDPSTIYIFPLILLLVFLIYDLWKLFEPINAIKINTTQKFFILITRNQLKRLFNRSSRIFFSEIKEFMVSEASGYFYESKRYVISVILKDSTNIVFTQTLKKTTAQEILIFLNLILITNGKD